MRSPDLSQKFRGALVGAAVGDALGASFEGMEVVEWSALEPLEREPGPLRYTDDTHMTIGMAQSLVEREGFDGAHIAAPVCPKPTSTSSGADTGQARLAYFVS